jgi:hypothetical protein
MKKYPWIRTVYLYLFSMLGLVLLVIGAVNFINMGLKAWVFTGAEMEERVWSLDRPYYDYEMKDITEIETEEGEICLSEDEKERLDEWLTNYEEREAELEDYDPVITNRHQTAAIALALMLVGLPLFLFHWFTIRKENKE